MTLHDWASVAIIAFYISMSVLVLVLLVSLIKGMLRRTK